MTAAQPKSARRRLAALLLLACAAAQPLWATAASKPAALYKCVDAAGVTSIQSNPCPAGSTQAWRRDAPSEPVLTPGQVAQAEAKRMRDQQAVRELSEIVDKKFRAASGALAPTPIAAAESAPGTANTGKPADAEAVAVDACQKAQAFAGSVREQAWLALSEEQVRRLYGWVAEQCKLPPPGN